MHARRPRRTPAAAAATCPHRTKPTRLPPPLALPAMSRSRWSPRCRALARQRRGLAAAVSGKGRTAARGTRASCSARRTGRRYSSMHRVAGLRDRACRKRSARLGWPVRDEMSSECAWFSAVPPVLARARCRAPAGRAACAGGGCSFVCARASPRPRLHARRCAIVRASRCRRQRINLGVGGGGHGLG